MLITRVTKDGDDMDFAEVCLEGEHGFRHGPRFRIWSIRLSIEILQASCRNCLRRMLVADGLDFFALRDLP